MDNFCTIVCSRRTTALCYQCELSMFSLSSKCSVLLVLVTRMMSFMQATKTSAYTRTLHSTRQDKVTLFSFLSNFFIPSPSSLHSIPRVFFIPPHIFFILSLSPFQFPGFLLSFSHFPHSLSICFSLSTFSTISPSSLSSLFTLIIIQSPQQKDGFGRHLPVTNGS